jgi:ferredoxin-type protein NapH
MLTDGDVVMSTTVAQGQSCPQPSFFEKNKFTILRNVVYLTVIFFLIILPTFKIVKIDIARNQAFIFGKQVPLAEGLAPVIFALGIFAILVIVLNLILGRVFCGWICPGGWFAELQEKFRKMWWTPKSPTGQKITYIVFTLFTSVIFSLLFLNWVTDLRVFFYVTNPSFVPMWLVFLGMTGMFYFCMKAQSEKCLPVAMGIVKELPPRDPDFISGKSLNKHTN